MLKSCLRCTAFLLLFFLSCNSAWPQGQVNLTRINLGQGVYRIELWYALGETADESQLQPVPGAIINYSNSIFSPRFVEIPGTYGGDRVVLQARFWRPDPRAFTYLEAEAADPLCESIPRWISPCLQSKSLGGKDRAGNVVLPFSFQIPGDCLQPLRGCIADPPSNYDPTFSQMGSGFDGDVNGVELLDSGKMWVAGAFQHWNRQPISRLALLTADGAVENAPWLVSPPNGDIFGTARATNGSILLAGAFTEVSGRPFNGIAQLLPNGAPDPTFKSEVVFGPKSNGSTISHPICMAVQDDGKIWVAGGFGEVNGRSQGGFVRLLPNGALDPEFQLGSGVNDTVFCIYPLSGGEALIGGRFSAVFNPGSPAWNQPGIVKVKADGTIDPNWNHGLAEFSTVYTIAPMPLDFLMIGGLLRFTNTNGPYPYSIAASWRNGALAVYPIADLTWNWNGGPDPAQQPAYVSALKTTKDGKTVVAGRFHSAAGYFRSALTRYSYQSNLLPPGFPPELLLDLNINNGLGFSEEVENPNGLSLIRGIKEQPDGKLLVFGTFSRYEDRPAGKLVRLFAHAERPEEQTVITQGASPYSVQDDQIAWKSAPGKASWLESTINFSDWTVVAPRETNVFRTYPLMQEVGEKQRFYRVRR